MASVWRRSGGDILRSSPPWVLDALLGLAIASIVSLSIAVDIGDTGSGGWAHLWAVGFGGLMLLRRHVPVLVAAVSVAFFVAYYASGHPAIGVAVPMAAAVFSAAEFGRVGVAMTASAAVIAVSLAYRLTAGQDPGFVVGYELPGHVILLAGAIALGDSLRSRRRLRWQASRIAELFAERYSREAQEKITFERLETARELHDSIGHALTVVSLHAQVAEEAVGSDDPTVRSALATIRRTSSVALADVRRTVAGLRRDEPVPMRHVGAPAFREAIRPAERAGFTVATVIDLPSPLPETVAQALFRILQESVTNVVRHSSGNELSVTIRETPREVHMRVVSDGAPAHGPSSEEESRGHGIAGMRERAELLGGTCRAGPEGDAFVVHVSVPRGEDSDACPSRR